MKLPFKVVKYNVSNNLVVLDEKGLEKPHILATDLFNSPFVAQGKVKFHIDLLELENNLMGSNALLTTFENILDKFPKDVLLNIPEKIGTLDELYPIGDEFLLRPVTDNKALVGRIYTEGEFYAIRRNAKQEKNHLLLSSNFFMSPYKKIKEEYRFFIVGNKISTYSSYMLSGKLNIDLDVPKDVIAFVETQIQRKNIGESYVVDVARTDSEELKIVEFNGLGASGLYNSDAHKLLSDISEYYKIY